MSGRTNVAPGRRPIPEPREISADLTSAGEPEGTGLAADPPFRWPSGRAMATLLILMVVLLGAAYPYAFSVIASVATPSTATGANITLGQNITNPELFWMRPSPIDYQPFSGAGNEAPYGPTNPALYNATEAYIQQYGLANVSVPLNLVAPSESGLDPAITPEAALVQIPRVAHFSHLSQAALLQLVDTAIVPPVGGFIGPAYVNVISLDQTLIALLGGNIPLTPPTTSTG
ncbi:MAG TPA: potassium-transporting ATPase subunit C [Thermoplasmata archaeon]|jgi:K+-transporting ATPase ATPase C chain|nr:potassium-transporting ATPase subunit C [Thermoplasmata archaeon]